MEKLGIQPIQLLFQAINFLLLMVILKKFLYQPIFKMLSDRKKKIEEGLIYSEKMKIEFEKSEKKSIEIVEKGKSEAQKIVDEAIKEAKNRQNQIIEKAEKEAAEIIERAQKEIDILREKLEKDLHKKAIVVAERIVEKVVKRALSESAHRSIIDKKLKEITNQLK